MEILNVTNKFYKTACHARLPLVIAKLFAILELNKIHLRIEFPKYCSTTFVA